MASCLTFILVASVSLQFILPVRSGWQGEWDADELDIFDLVEEVGENFYDVMQIDQTASQSDIRRAYRKLSLQLHPDKSDDPNAAQKFQKMVTVYDVLKDEGKRRIYDEVLEQGLPDWRQPVFYYRKVRKMGFLEVSVILLGITSVGHYLYGWANYVEQKLIVHDLLERKKKKEQRKMRQIKALHAKQVMEAELEMKTAQAQASKPKLKNLLPILIIRHLVLLLLAVWAYIYRKFIKKDTSSCNSSKTVSKKSGNSRKDNSNKSPSVRRRNGKIRSRRLESESSEGELEKKEEPSTDEMGVKTNGIGKTESLESVDESEDEKATTTKTSKLPGKKGEKKKPDMDGARKVGEGKGAGNTGMDLKEDKIEVAVESSKVRRKESPKETAKLDSESEKLPAVGISGKEEKKTGKEEVGKGVDKMKGSKLGSGGKDEHCKENTSAQGAGNKGNKDGSLDTDVVAGKSRREENLEQRKQDDNVSGLKQPGNESSVESSIDGPSSEGWKVAGSGRNKAQKKKAVVERKASVEQEGSKSTTTTISPPSLDSPKESSTSQNGTWTQLQQDMLEWGLSNYPKSSEDRWLNIAKAVPGKSMEDCKLRCIHLYEELKQKKSS